MILETSKELQSRFRTQSRRMTGTSLPIWNSVWP